MAISEAVSGVALTLTRRLGNTCANPAVGAAVVRDDGSGPVIVGHDSRCPT
jgi:hypothetical protein